MAAYITRSSLELQLLCKAMGGQPHTISGLAGVGGNFVIFSNKGYLIYYFIITKDLMLTAFGDLSRNRTCGVRLTKGETLEEITKDSTVEGYI
jgi:glycerol-3-phosphate dehydrogenase (NAD+)